MTPKLGIVGLGQHASSNSAAKAQTGSKNQSNFAIYNNQQLGSAAGLMQAPPASATLDSYVQGSRYNKA